MLFFIGVIYFFHAEKIPLKLWMFGVAAAAYWSIIFFNVLTPLAGIFLTYCMAYVGFIRFPLWDRLVKSDYFLWAVPLSLSDHPDLYVRAPAAYRQAQTV